jgi:predicted glycosyltransferase
MYISCYNKTVKYDGYHELAYLHPKRFTPDPKVLEGIGLKENEPYFILRFNAFKAHHDIGEKGLSLEDKRKLISVLEKRGRVFITTERKIDKEFEKYQLSISPEKIHSLIYFSTMLIGDSQTMTSEAAVLGIPSIRCNTFVGKISYLEEEEHKYQLTYGFRPTNSKEMFLKIETLLDMPYLKNIWQERRNRMLMNKIDVTAFYVWFIEKLSG